MEPTNIDDLLMDSGEEGEEKGENNNEVIHLSSSTLGGSEEEMKQEHSEGGEEDRTELQSQEESEDDDWSGVVPPFDIAEAVAEYRGTELCSLNFKKRGVNDSDLLHLRRMLVGI